MTCVTISEEQFKFAQKRIQEKGLENLIDIKVCDYRKLGTSEELGNPSSFDKIVSIEMLEAVGHSYLPEFFQTCNRMLKDDGVALIQVITIPDERYEDYCYGSDFIREYIFPGGHLPSPEALKWATDTTSLQLDLMDDIGPDYAVTLRMWRERFLAKKSKILELGYSERFIRLWEFYFAFCEVGFQKKHIQDYHLRYMKKKSKVPKPLQLFPFELASKKRKENKNNRFTNIIFYLFVLVVIYQLIKYIF